MQTWRTALATSDATSIHIRGYDITDLMEKGSFIDTIFLLHRGRLPQKHERKLLDAILVASADHGAGAPSCATARLVASGNRQSLSAAVAAGILAIGDEHGGAGSLWIEILGAALVEMKRDSLSVAETAARVVEESRQQKRRLPGFGHRVHTVDPRVAVLFDMARASGMNTDGCDLTEAIGAELGARVKPLPINVDGALAAVLYDLGFPPSAGKLIFMIGRVAGLTAEVAEEYQREKPMRIKIPVEYDGEPARPFETQDE